MNLKDVTYKIISNKEILYLRRFIGHAIFKHTAEDIIVPIKFDVEKTATGYKVHVTLLEEVDYPTLSIISQIRSWVEDNIV